LPDKKMTPDEAIAQWKSIAEEERTRAEQAEAGRDGLRLELYAEKYTHRKDNEYLVSERDRLRVENADLRGGDLREQVVNAETRVRELEDAIGDFVDYATDKIKELTWGE